MGFTLNQLEQERQIRKLQKKEDKDTKDYEQLSNLPKINNVELKGDKTTSNLGINADNVMMSDGVTSVEDAVDDVKSGLNDLTKVETVTATVISGANITIDAQDLVRYCGVISGQMSITTSATVPAWTDIIDLGVNSKTKGGFVGFNQGVAKPFYTEKNSSTIRPFVSLPSGETYMIWVNVYV